MKKLLIITLFLFINIFTIYNINAQTSNFYVYNNNIGTSGGSNNRLVKKDTITNNQLATVELGNPGDFIADLKIDPLGNIYVALMNSNGPFRILKLDSNLNIIWTNNNHTSFVEHIAVDANGFVYTASTGDNTVRKIDPNGIQVWVFPFGNNVFDVDVDEDGFVYAGGRDRIVKIDPNGNQVWSYTTPDFTMAIALDSNKNVYGFVRNNDLVKLNTNGNLVWSVVAKTNTAFPRALVVDKDDHIYHEGDNLTVIKRDSSGTIIQTFLNTHPNPELRRLDVDFNLNLYVNRTNVVRVFDSTGTLKFDNTDASQATTIAVAPSIPEPPFYDLSFTSNHPNFIDLVYVDISGTSIGSTITKTIPNDLPFSITSGVIDTTPFTFNYWWDLDNQTVFSTNRTFDIGDPDRNYNLEANFTLNTSSSIQLNSNLPTPQNIIIVTDTLEGNKNTISNTSINLNIPENYEFSFKAPTDNVGVYVFDFWFNNDNNTVFTTSAIVTTNAINNLNLTAVYSLPSEYQINLTLEVPVGFIIFQHGNLPPISGPFISAVVGVGDQWTATAPLNQDFRFLQWIDLENLNQFSITRQIDIGNTNRNYILRADYIDLITINWDSLGGTVINPQKVDIFSFYNAPINNPIRPNFFFGGWALPSAPNTPITFPQQAFENITYQAIWLPTYQLTFNVNAGQPIPSQTIIENNLPTVVTPSRFGYTFDGWYTDNITFNNTFNFNAPFTSNTTIHAKWIFGTSANVETSLQSFLGEARLDNPLAQWILVLSLFILLNVMIFIYKAPFIVTVILNFILTALFIVFGFIPIWITIVLFMAIFGFMILMLSGGRS